MNPDDRIQVHARVHWRHPEIDDEDVIQAWCGAMLFAERTDSPHRPAYAAIGYDSRGRPIELVATIQSDGTVLIYHAMTPPRRAFSPKFWAANGGNDDHLPPQGRRNSHG